jgi:hypothetical protein
LSERITALYRLLPRFYVGVVFQAVPKDSFYVGAEPADDFVRIWIDHIARQFPNAELKARWIAAADAALAPFVKERGLRWELHVDETPFDLWSIQGIRPPAPNSEHEQRWIAENEPSPYPPPPEPGS